MKYCLLLYLTLFTILASNAQRSAIWCFGDSAGINFKTSPPSTFISTCKSRGSSASISDKQGNLLFYSAYDTDGLSASNGLLNGEVYTRMHHLMLNGDSILCRAWYMELVIIPDPSDTNKYYLFSIGVTSIFGLYYSVIDMTQNNGLGAVIQKNVQLNAFESVDCISAIKHGNGRDWWILFRRWDNLNNTFYKFLITPSGISGPYLQNIGEISDNGFLRMIFSSSGTKLAVLDYRGLIETFNFNRCNGMLSDYKLIRQENPTSPFPELWSGEFSPSERYLYIATNGYVNNSELYQLDLQDSFPLSNADTLYSSHIPINAGGLLKLAPDGKIYWSCVWDDGMTSNYPYPDTTYNIYNTYLSVINKPDSADTASNFQAYSFYLGGARTYWGLPNNPNYELGADSGSICDSLTVGITQNEHGNLNADMYVFYHQDWQTVFINAKGLRGKKYMLTVVDVLGHTIYAEDGKLDGQYFTHDLHMQGFADGVYIVSFVTDKEVLSRKFVRQ